MTEQNETRNIGNEEPLQGEIDRFHIKELTRSAYKLATNPGVLKTSAVIALVGAGVVGGAYMNSGSSNEEQSNSSAVGTYESAPANHRGSAIGIVREADRVNIHMGGTLNSEDINYRTIEGIVDNGEFLVPSTAVGEITHTSDVNVYGLPLRGSGKISGKTSEAPYKPALAKETTN